DATRGATDAEIQLVDGGFAWSFATVRFTILLDGTSWREVGEASADGKSWTKFMQTELVRVGARAPAPASEAPAGALRVDGDCRPESLSIDRVRELGARDVRWTHK